MDIGAAGALILFFSLFILLILVALVVFSYAAYSFLLTLTCTAAGNDEVIWPGEPIQDWFFKVWYLGWLLALWAVPASFIVAALRLPRPLFAVAIAAVLWLAFPIGLLSSLSAESRLVVFRPVIVRLLLKHPGRTLFFYASSGGVVFGCAALIYAALFGTHLGALDQPLVLVPLAAVAGAAGFLVYARLLGRLAFILSQTSLTNRKRRSREQPSETDRVEISDPWSVAKEESAEEGPPPRHAPANKRPSKKMRRRQGSKQVVDPWAVSEEQPIPQRPRPSASSLPDDPYGPAEGTYDVLAGTAADSVEPASSSARRGNEEVEPYDVSTAAPQGPGKLPPPVAPEVSKLEEELAAPRRQPPLPEKPLLAGVYSFPFYAPSRGPYATLALGFLGVLGLIRLLIAAFPV